MAGDGPTIVGEKRVERIHRDLIDVVKLPHISPWSL
jgi:hypothetical protein